MPYQRDIEIDAPAATIWPILMDIESWPEWSPSMTSIRKLDEGPLRPGSRAEIKQPRMPKMLWTVTDVEEWVNFTWEARLPGSRTVAHHRIAPLEDGGRCRVTLEVEEDGPLAKLLGPIFAPTVRKYVRMEAEGLKARAESGSGAP